VEHGRRNHEQYGDGEPRLPEREKDERKAHVAGVPEQDRGQINLHRQLQRPYHKERQYKRYSYNDTNGQKDLPGDGKVYRVFGERRYYEGGRREVYDEIIQAREIDFLLFAEEIARTRDEENGKDDIDYLAYYGSYPPWASFNSGGEMNCGESFS
jgi:hypothetical protein